MKIKTIRDPQRLQWDTLCRRANLQGKSLRGIVNRIITNVKRNGDAALYSYAQEFDHAALSTLKVSGSELQDATVPHELGNAIAAAAANIRAFHAAQKPAPVVTRTAPGIVCFQKAVPIERVGLYIPGGNAPLFSTVLMLAIPAAIAGCKDIVLCTPPDSNGNINPAILYAAKTAGVTAIYKVGGAQAIAAMAFGTESVPRVDKIFGPGNRFVTEAKKLVSASGVAIDMPAGPSEVMILADDSADADFVACDFLSQAEHGPDSQSILVTNSEALAARMPEAIDNAIAKILSYNDDNDAEYAARNIGMIHKSLSHSRIIIFSNEAEMWEFANAYAPEHLIVSMRNANDAFTKVKNAGSVFLGNYSPESVGDYASGTNHTLPTSGFARAFSGVNLDSYQKKITFQRLTREGLAGISQTVRSMAHAEHLLAHREAVIVRGSSSNPAAGTDATEEETITAFNNSYNNDI